jgi:hypothetical protein
MSSTDPDNKVRNRKIAQNEERRGIVGAVRVSGWAIAMAVIAGVIVFAFVGLWLRGS